VNELLPKLVWIIASREEARLRQLVKSGQVNPLLREGSIAGHAAGVGGGFAAALAVLALGNEIPPPDDPRDELTGYVREAAAIVPVPIDEELLARWIVQLTGGEIHFSYERTSQIDAATFWIFMAVGAGAAMKVRWKLRDIQHVYDQVLATAERG
jgi:H+/Cl- antiporter ClcA